MSDVLTSKLASVFIQKQPGEEPEWLGCAKVDSLSEPQGDQTLVQCVNADGEYETVGATQAPPGNGSFTIEAKIKPEADILDELSKNCDLTAYLLSRNCGRKNDFTGWQYARVARARIINWTDSGLVSTDEDVPTLRQIEFSVRNPVYRPRTVTVGRQTTAAAYALNDIAFCNLASCGNDCGAPKDLGTDGFAIGDLSATSPAANAKAWVTDDKGVVWAQSAGDTFDFIGDAGAAECFRLNSTTTRWIIARKQVAAEGMEIAYSDDDGATWTTVNVGSTANEGVVGANGLFAMDKDHIWLATTAGNVYFSDDAGVSFTVQSTALTASGGNALNAIHFADADNGFAVGASDTIIKTNDGGTSWSAVTAPTSGSSLLSVFVFSKYRFLFGSGSDELYISWDGGTAFTRITDYTTEGATSDFTALDFVNGWVGFAVYNTAAPVGKIMRTIDGGHTWEDLTTPTNSGINAIHAVDVNTAFVCGEVNSATAFIAKVSP